MNMQRQIDLFKATLFDMRQRGVAKADTDRYLASYICMVHAQAKGYGP